MTTQYTPAFEAALDHAMLYEVGGWWKLTPEVEAGLMDTPARRKAVGYVNNPNDKGGETKYGIAKKANPNVSIPSLTWEDAKAIYYTNYWLKGGCHLLPGRVAVLHFDGCANHGVGKAGRFLQEAAGAFVDGDVGPDTAKAVKRQSTFDICAKVCNRREQFYRSIVANDSTQAQFLAGWLRRINEMRAFVLQRSRSFE